MNESLFLSERWFACVRKAVADLRTQVGDAAAPLEELVTQRDNFRWLAERWEELTQRMFCSGDPLTNEEWTELAQIRHAVMEEQGLYVEFLRRKTGEDDWNEALSR